MPDEAFNRNDLLSALQSNSSTANDATLKYSLDKFLKSGQILRVGRNKYIKSANRDLSEYTNLYSEISNTVIAFMEEKYPLLDYQIWELSWMNEFVNHLLARNLIFVEVEKSACEFVFNDLTRSIYAKVLLKPSEKEMNYYTDDNTIIVIPQITGSPIGKPNKYNVPLEKIIVDLFANPLLGISRGDYPNAFKNIFEKYIINYSKLFRYAGRRSKEEEIKCYLQKILPQSIYPV